MGRVNGKVAIVSGAASGLGAASARMLAREGAAVVLADINDAAGEAVAREIEAAGGRATYVHLDATREEDWVRARQTVKELYGRLNVAVNSAGINLKRMAPTDITLEQWRGLLALNLDGVFLGTKHAVLAMKESQPVSGSIINVSSVMGLVSMPDIAAYSASKGGVRLFSKSVALSCAEQRLNIRVNSLHPGFIDTPLLRFGMARYADQAEAQRVYDATQPVGHLGEPDDIAYGVLYLASDEAKFVTGSELVIDGGYTAR